MQTEAKRLTVRQNHKMGNLYHARLGVFINKTRRLPDILLVGKPYGPALRLVHTKTAFVSILMLL